MVLALQDILSESLRSKNAVKMRYRSKDLAIKIFGGELRNLRELAVSAGELDVTLNQELTPGDV